MEATRQHMPAKNHSSAPRFDPTHPRELPAYFEELEALFQTANVVGDQVKKGHAKRYAPFEDGELWASLPEYADAIPYAEFKSKVLQQYPGATEERRYSLPDVDKLVGERIRLGIISLEELATYYRKFYVMTKYLIDNGRYSAAEQSRAFVRGFKPELWAHIAQRLQLKLPDHHPDDAYTLDQIQEAAKFVLQGSTFHTGTISASPAPLETRPTQTVQSPTTIKTEDLFVLFERFAQNIAASISAGAGGPSHNGPAAAPRPSNRGCCNFCGDPAHYIHRCPICEQYRLAGKVRKNAEGKVVLPSGAFVPSHIPGQWLKDRIDEWYRQNPAPPSGTVPHAAAPTLFYGLLNPTTPSPPAAATTLQVAVAEQDCEQQINQLQQQIMALHAKKKKMVFDGIEINTRARGGPKTDQTKAAASTSTEKATTIPQEQVPVADSAPFSSQIPAAPVVPAENISASHPFTGAKDANYLPPKNRNFGAAPPAKGRDPSYHAQAPIQDVRIADSVYKRTIENQAITLSYEELLALSPEVRQRYREALTPKRVPSAKTHLLTEEVLPFAGDNRGGATDGTIIQDPLEIYFNSAVGPETIPIRVAKESHSLRSIMMLVDSKEEVESVLDPGSMIIAISEACCNSIGLLYDPTFRLHMESANGEVDESLGLARNVPFTIGPITIFLQLHVVKSPAYDILLGRPFDVLTQSIIKNYQNEDMTITIEDPNSRKIVTIPTLRRGPPRYSMAPARKPDFRQGRD